MSIFEVPAKQDLNGDDQVDSTEPKSNEKLVHKWMYLGGEKPIDAIMRYMTNKEHLISRATNRVLSGNGANSDFVEIYHRRLDDADKKKIFPSSYDIGSPEQNNGLKDFYSYISVKRGLDQSIDPIDYDLSVEIKRFIYEATGISFVEYEKKDESLAYKVLGLLYLQCKEFPQLLNFLSGGRESQTNFEFRFSHPLTSNANQDLHERSLKNTAHFSEILGLLTCQLPKKYLDQALKLYIDIPNSVNSVVQRLTRVAKRHSNAAGQETINQISEMVFPKLDGPQFDRLDFKLFTALVLREYEVRLRSDAIIKKILREYPMELRSFSEVNVLGMNEEQIITHLLGGVYIKPKDLDDKALFLEQIIRSYKPDIQMNRYKTAVIKALIIHDLKLSIKVPCQLHGAKNIPESANSIFRNISGKKVINNREDRAYFMTNGQEALVYFWETRINLACTVVQCDSVELAKEVFFNKDACEKIVDSTIITYLKNANRVQIEYLPMIFEAFSKNLLQYLAGSAYRLHCKEGAEYAVAWKVA